VSEQSTEDPFAGTVYFLLPGGEKISNDPRFSLAEMRAQVLTARPHSGVEALRDVEVKVATIGSGDTSEEGVGDASDVLAGRQDGRSLQHKDRILAEMTGVSSSDPAVKVPVKIDSNEEVLKLREDEEPETALDQLQGKSYDEWSSGDLKAEVKRRRESGREIDTSGVTRKAQLASLLREDDEAARAEQ
jgi:hypothetical protein